MAQSDYEKVREIRRKEQAESTKKQIPEKN
jgi:hypothetical protein